jgi:hypothetical protein
MNGCTSLPVLIECPLALLASLSLELSGFTFSVDLPPFIRTAVLRIWSRDLWSQKVKNFFIIILSYHLPFSLSFSSEHTEEFF